MVLMDISQKISDLALFGANAEDGVITPDEMMNSPASLFGRQLSFGYNSMRMAGSQAATQMQLYKQHIMATNPQQAQMLETPQAQRYLMQGFMKQALESQGKRIAKFIAAEENKLQMKKTKLETQLKAAQSELQSCEKAEDNGIKQATPKYA